jgi:hypothetical protein
MNVLRLLILLAATTFVLAGCKTTAEPENASERPWNAQKGWEHGLPTGINQGR